MEEWRLFVIAEHGESRWLLGPVAGATGWLRHRFALSCGITARPDQRPATVASSDTLAGRLDKLQYADGIGPCMHALNTGEVVQIDDLADDGQWGVYPSDAYAHGLLQRDSFDGAGAEQFRRAAHQGVEPIRSAAWRPRPVAADCAGRAVGRCRSRSEPTGGKPT
jgi:hypothetical protein